MLEKLSYDTKIGLRLLGVAILVASSLAGSGCSATKMAAAPTTSSSMGNLATSSGSLNFGSVQVGASKTLPLSLSNTGPQSTAVRISAVSVSGPGFMASGLTTPLTLASGQTVTFSVRLVPAASGSIRGSLLIASDAANPNVTVSLSGTGMNVAAGQLSVTPSSVNFGDVTLGSSLSQSGSLMASGNSVIVSSASWNGTGFTLSGISFPLTIGPGQSVPFTVTFAPQSVGNVSGGVSFLSNAANSPGNEQWSGIGALASQHRVDLNWNPSSGTVQGYYVYRSGQTGGPYARLSSLSSSTAYADTAVASGQTYYYVVTALGTNFVESGYSNETVAYIP